MASAILYPYRLSLPNNTMLDWFRKYPNISMWIVLAIGMIAILVFEARDVGLNGSQWFWLITIVIIVAGACVWIVSWGDDDLDDSVQGPKY